MAEKLAIYSDLLSICELIEKNIVSSIIAPTGSGKSIGVLYALIRGTSTTKGKRVMCTQPTIPAATSLFEYQKKLSPDFKIGFAAEGTINYAKDTQCIYCTAGHLRKVMKGHFKGGKASVMLFTDVLIVDEIHVGSRDNSIIIDLWCEAFRQLGSKGVPKLVLATATEFGCHELMQKLSSLTTPKAPKPAVFRSTFRHHPVQVRYQRRDYEEPDSEDSFPDAARIAVDLLVEKRGHGIVFCSGSGEVEEIVYELNNLLDSRRLRNTFDRPVKVIGCYGQSKREDIDDAICDENDKPETERCIKIVVTTNLCESSLTVPDVIFIVDCMTEKRSDLLYGRFHLGTTWISKNSADQRKGRTGRTLNGGVCHRMCTEEAFKKLEDFRPLEIKRTPISDIVIEFMTCGLDPVKVISDLEHTKLAEAKEVLMETGCIKLPDVKKTEKELYDEQFPAPVPIVTQLGYFVSEMPMDVRNAAALYNYLNSSTDKNNFWAVMAFVVVDIYGPSLFYFLRKEKHENPRHYRARLQEHAEKYFHKFMGENPVESLLLALYDCLKETGGLGAPFYKIKKWAIDNSCNNKKLREIFVQIKRIQGLLNRFKFPGEGKAPPGKRSCEYDSRETTKVIENIRSDVIKAFTESYKTKILQSMYGDYLAPDGRKVKVDTMKTVSRTGPPSRAIPLSEIHIKNKDNEQIMISLWIPEWVDLKAIEAERLAFKTKYNLESDSDDDSDSVLKPFSFVRIGL